MKKKPESQALVADGLPISDVHRWAHEKHARLRKYVDAAHGARRSVSQQYSAKCCYVDLFCGPGRSRVIETGELIDGSPLVAFEAAALHGDQFAEFLIGDAEAEYVRAAEQRLRSRGARVRAFVGEAHVVMDDVAKALDPNGLHLAFLDPYNLGDLPFSVISKLAALKHMDLLIHVSSMDLKRELRNYLEPDGRKALDDFAPDWRKHVNVKQRQDIIRQEIFAHWQSCLERLGTSANDCVEAVDNSKRSDIYWLVFVARHRLAHKLWRKIANVSDQGRLFG